MRLTLTPTAWARVCAEQQRRWSRRAHWLDVWALALVLIAFVPPQVSWSEVRSLTIALAYRLLSGLAKTRARHWRASGESVARAVLDPEHAGSYLAAAARNDLRLIK